jgi:hypothetical protein
LISKSGGELLFVVKIDLELCSLVSGYTLCCYIFILDIQTASPDSDYNSEEDIGEQEVMYKEIGQLSASQIM